MARRNRESREDMLQESKRMVLEHGGNPEDEDQVQAIFRTLTLPQDRSYRGRLKEQLTDDGEIEIEDPTDVDLHLDVRRVLSKLTGLDRMIADYIFLRGWSARMLAEKIGRSPGVVDVRLIALKEKLRTELADLA